MMAVQIPVAVRTIPTATQRVRWKAVSRSAPWSAKSANRQQCSCRDRPARAAWTSSWVARPLLRLFDLLVDRFFELAGQRLCLRLRQAGASKDSAEREAGEGHAAMLSEDPGLGCKVGVGFR